MSPFPCISRFLRKNLRRKPSRQSTVSSKKNSAWSMIFPPVKTEIKTSESGLLHTNRMSFYSRIISENIERGISEGFYRRDFNKELVTLFFTSAMSRIYSWNGAYKFFKDPYVFHSELIRYHLESIVNDQGREVLNEIVLKRGK